MTCSHLHPKPFGCRSVHRVIHNHFGPFGTVRNTTRTASDQHKYKVIHSRSDKNPRTPNSDHVSAGQRPFGTVHLLRRWWRTTAHASHHHLRVGAPTATGRAFARTPGSRPIPWTAGPTGDPTDRAAQ